MAAIRFSTLKRTLNSSFKLANQIDIRSTYACRNGNLHTRETTNSKSYAAPKCFNLRGLHFASGISHVSSYLSGGSDNKSLRGSKSIVLTSPIWNSRWYSSSVSSKGDTPKGSEVITGASGSDMDTGGVSGSEWVGNIKEAWQTAMDAVNYTSEKAKEASSEMTPYVEHVLDAHPYLRDVVVPVGGTLTGTLMAWVVLPRFLRRFHKYSNQGPATLFPGSSIWGQVPYEKSIWGAMEDPVRYLITFMAFSQIAVMVAPSSIASQYLLQTWQGAAILSFVWFLQRWKTNVISRTLVVKGLEVGDRDRLLTLDRISSVGLFVLGLMTLAEVCGVAVQSILTVGGIGGVATAFAARDILGNVLSGLSVQLSQPFSVGDTIKAGSVEGQVVEMGLTSTSLLTAEKFPVIVPNSLFSSQDRENIRDETGKQQLLSWWKTRIRQFPKLSRMVRDLLSAQASSVASEQAFSAGRFIIGDHRYSLARDSLEISVLFRDWINAERRNFGLPKLPPHIEEEIDEIFDENSDDGMEPMEQQGNRPIPEDLSVEELEKLRQKNYRQFRY